MLEIIRINRRILLLGPLPGIIARLSKAAAAEYENLEYREGRLHWSRGSAIAAVGRSGVQADKHEGDGATPAGTYPLVSVYYRPDKIARPTADLPVSPLAPNHGWVDAPADLTTTALFYFRTRRAPRKCGGRTTCTMRWW
jgi:L,D-peptidoglycan transpeptidase YkuD (ErfK/YbiS/YcfS/YnhG family)